MYGAGWEVLNGSKLNALLRTTAEGSEDMKISLRRLLPEYATWPIRHGAESDWGRFLKASEVVDCLRPVGGESSLQDLLLIPAVCLRQIRLC